VSGETLLHRRMGECGLDRRHVAAFVDWLACAFAGAGERAARCAASAVDGLGGRVLAAGTAGHTSSRPKHSSITTGSMADRKSREALTRSASTTASCGNPSASASRTHRCCGASAAIV